MVLVCREARGTPTCTTVAGANVRLEIYPVGTLTKIKASDPVNKIKNPSGIVIYKDSDVTENTAAILEITRYLPTNLNLTDDDSRVTWSITSRGGEAKFFKGKAVGSTVRIYGTKAGEILVEADYGWINKVQFRAVVVDLKQIKFRVSRIRSASSEPIPTVDDIKNHIRIANIYLRQIGIKLVPDSNEAVAASAGNAAVGDPTLPTPPLPPPAITSVTDQKINKVKMVEKGYFDVEVNHDATTRSLGSTPDMINAIRINAVNEILNIAYIHSINNPPTGGGNSTLGIALLRPPNYGAPPATPRAPSAAVFAGTHTLTDSGTPSTSWVAPNGLPAGSIPSPAPPVPSGASSSRTAGLATRDGPGGDPTGTPAATVSMQIMSANPKNFQPLSPATRDIDLLWGVVMDGQTYPEQTFANTLAHEVGHALGLRHRNGAGNDTVAWPQWENLMDGSAPTPDCENLDIAQCKAVRFTEFLFRPNALSTDPEVEPSDQSSVLTGMKIGAVIGAIVGAIAGAIIGFVMSGGNPAAAAAGAAAGAAIGAALGGGIGALAGALAGPPSGP